MPESKALKFKGNTCACRRLLLRTAIVALPLSTLAGCMSAAMTDIAKPAGSNQLEIASSADAEGLQNIRSESEAAATGPTASPMAAQNEQTTTVTSFVSPESQATGLPASTDSSALATAIHEPTQVNAGQSSIYANAQTDSVIEGSTPAGPVSGAKPSVSSLFSAPPTQQSPIETALVTPRQKPALKIQSEPETELEEFDEDAPTGLMKLISAPGMARVAANGLWVQTEKVDTHCFKPDLIGLIHKVEKHYGKPAIVTSGFRSIKNNRKAGGASFSRHTTCDAADIQVEGVTKWDLAEYLRALPNRGGVGTYCYTKSVHIDTGSQRDWNWRCLRKKKKP